MERCVNIDGKISNDHNYPAGFIDVLELEKSGDQFRLMLDSEGLFVLHQNNWEEAVFKICRIVKAFILANKIPVSVTHDEGTIHYPDPAVKVNNTVNIDIASDKMTRYALKFEVGAMVTLTPGSNAGRLGQFMNIERQKGLLTF